MQHRDDEEYEILDAPDSLVNEREYIDNLRALSYATESQASLENSLRPDTGTYRPSVKVRVLRDTFEIKSLLQSQGDLEELKRLIKKYFENSQFKGAQIEILTKDNPELIEELRKFRISYKQERVIPFGIRLIHQGKVI